MSVPVLEFSDLFKLPVRWVGEVARNLAGRAADHPVVTLAALGGIVWFIYKYAKALGGSPRELWLLYGYKFAETTAYAMCLTTMTLSLKRDSGLGDEAASNYLLGYSILISIFAIAVGGLTDSLGLRRMMVASIGLLFAARVGMGLTSNPWVLAVFGALPMALGMAVVAPLVSMGVKRFTTKETAAHGFAFYYIIMNVGFAVGGGLLDAFRTGIFAERNDAGKIVNENAGAIIAGYQFSTYKILFLSSLAGTVLSLLAVAFMRPAITEGNFEDATAKPSDKGTSPTGRSLAGHVLAAFASTGSALRSAARERYFWIFMGLVAATLFVQAVNRHFSLTFPDYGIRVLGEGAKIGSVYGVLNPVLIIVLVPIVAALTKRVKSFTMLIIGATISTGSCFLAAIPGHHFAGLNDTALGRFVFIDWLGLADSPAALAANPPCESYWPLMIFILVFTVGEAIWSPRFYQFTAECAPKGREATYLSLSTLPAFGAKFIVMSMSGLLLAEYVPVDKATKTVLPHPDHAFVWVWIGVASAVTPIGLLILKPFFERAHAKQIEASRTEA